MDATTIMKRTMKAAVVREFGKPLAIEDVPIPEVGPGQVLVAIGGKILRFARLFPGPPLAMEGRKGQGILIQPILQLSKQARR